MIEAAEADPERFGHLPAKMDKTRKVDGAFTELKRAEAAAKLEDIATIEAKAAAGVYDVLVIDPPWQMQKIEREVRPNQAGFDYPTMDAAALAVFGETVRALTAEDCHAFIRTTQKHLPLALSLLDGWGLRYVLAMVWHKPGGFQPVGLPQYNCEFAIYARKGSPEFIDTKAFPVCFQAPRREHSRKPDEFYDLIRRVTAGRRIDVFSREPRDGFDQWGNEATKFRKGRLMAYLSDRRYSDGFIPAIKQIVGPHLLVITPDEIDCKQAADLMVFTAQNVKIAARVRRPGFEARYPYDITIRAQRDNGYETELAKIVNGFGDWLFYGHDDGTGAGFARWWLVDLAVFRAALIRRHRSSMRRGDIDNGDGTHLKWFDLRSFPRRPSILIAGSHSLSDDDDLSPTLRPVNSRHI